MLLANAKSAVPTVLDAIYQRRAVRNYSRQPVTRETIQALLDAAVQAPSAMNRQPWAFLVIQDKNLLKRISDAAKARILASAAWAGNLEHKHLPLDAPEFDIFYQGSTLIVICASEQTGFSPEGDCFLAAQNLMLAAQALGLASCPIGFARDILRDEEFKKELSIPASILPVLPIIVGYAAGATPAVRRTSPKIINWVTEQGAKL